MRPHPQHPLEQELDVIQRFADSYQRQFAVLIRQLNGPPVPGASAQGLRLCVEAVNMMLESHRTLATAVRELAQSTTVRRAA
ncbi:MAG: hypothetical protein ABSH20_18555 [Tepidisphaeraceae bacterium]|jgi:hypothetical protein